MANNPMENIEKQHKQHNSKNMHRDIKEITGAQKVQEVATASKIKMDNSCSSEKKSSIDGWNTSAHCLKIKDQSLQTNKI
jgi:hypothetical protein